jgi:arylsulfatase A-like enzyme
MKFFHICNKEAGIYDDSIIIVTSDHGGIETNHGAWDLNELDTPQVWTSKSMSQVFE